MRMISIFDFATALQILQNDRDKLSSSDFLDVDVENVAV